MSVLHNNTKITLTSRQHICCCLYGLVVVLVEGLLFFSGAPEILASVSIYSDSCVTMVRLYLSKQSFPFFGLAICFSHFTYYKYVKLFFVHSRFRNCVTSVCLHYTSAVSPVTYTERWQTVHW